MKNGYSGVESSELIQKYETFNDTIVITFLDDSTYEIPLTEENKKYLLNQMLEQTKERSESSALADAKKIRKKAILWSFVQAGFTMLNFIAANADSNHMKLLHVLEVLQALLY